MFHLKNSHQNNCIEGNMEFYLKSKPPDCVLYSADGTEFKTHKELLGQTKFMRELLKSSRCCGIIEIILPCLNDELGQIVEFVNHGKVFCDNETEFAKILKNLKNFLGYAADFSSAGKFSFEDQTQKLATDTFNENEAIEIISDDTIFVVPTNNIKKETNDEEVQAGLAILDEMDESILVKKIKTEPLDIQPKIEPIDSSINEIEREIVKVIKSDSSPAFEKEMISSEPPAFEFDLQN